MVLSHRGPVKLGTEYGRRNFIIYHIFCQIKDLKRSRITGKYFLFIIATGYIVNKLFNRCSRGNEWNISVLLNSMSKYLRHKTLLLLLVSSNARLKSKPYCEMKPTRAFTRLSIQFVAVIGPDRADGCKIVQPNAGWRTKLIRTFIDKSVSDAADVVK